MVLRRGLALRWRIALFSSLAIAFLSVLTSVAAYAVVRSSLVGDLQKALEVDVARVAAEYNTAQAETAQAEEEAEGAPNGELASGDLQSAATGGVIIQLYSASGERFAASNDTDETDPDNLHLPTEVVTAALAQPQSWRGEIAGEAVQAALAPVQFGATEAVVAVLSPAGYIGAALAQLARVLAVVAGVLIVLSVVLGYLVAAAAARPVTQLANAASSLGPDHLIPIEYRGPNDEVGRLSVVLNDLVLRLKTSIDAQRTFLAETSHELRTPLTSLQGFLDRSVRRAPPSLRGDLEDAQRIARSMSRLVADLLQLTRGQLVREYTPHLLDPATDILKPVTEEFPGVRLEARAGSLLLGDPERLKQLVRNLTANAVRATENPRKVTLGLVTTDDHIVLLVRDRGPGIAEELLPHLFEKFHKGAGGGAGLGLAIAKQIADAHSGSIEVDSFRGRGTTFRVTFPAVEEES
jgi:two-component system OmpR family sensor kinase